MVGDDDINPALCGIGNGFTAVDPAVHSDQNTAVSAGGLQSLCERIGGKTVAVVETVRQKICHNRAVAFQNPGEQSGGGDAIGIIISMNQDMFTVDDRLPKAFNGCFHTGETERIAEVGKRGIEIHIHMPGIDTTRRKIHRDRTRQRFFSDQVPCNCFFAIRRTSP